MTSGSRQATGEFFQVIGMSVAKVLHRAVEVDSAQELVDGNVRVAALHKVDMLDNALVELVNDQIASTGEQLLILADA